MRNAGNRQVDPLARQQLQRTQFVTGAGNGNGFIQGIAAENFKLAQGGGTVKSDGGADTRDDGIKKGN